MARKNSRTKISPLDFSSVADELVAVPRNFVFGLLTGLLAPVAAIAGIVVGIYLFTKKVPFITEIGDEDEERHLIIRLVQPEEARSLFQRGKEAVQTFGDEIRVELEGDQ